MAIERSYAVTDDDTHCTYKHKIRIKNTLKMNNISINNSYAFLINQSINGMFINYLFSEKIFTRINFCKILDNFSFSNYF